MHRYTLNSSRSAVGALLQSSTPTKPQNYIQIVRISSSTNSPYVTNRARVDTGAISVDDIDVTELKSRCPMTTANETETRIKPYSEVPGPRPLPILGNTWR